MKPACFMSKATQSVPHTLETNHSQFSSPVEELNLIVDSKSQPFELDNSTTGVTCAVEAKAKLAMIFVQWILISLLQWNLI